MHFQRKKFVCSVCDKEFKDQSNRNRHERLTHRSVAGAGTKFSCHICSPIRTFTRNDNLTLHMKRIHGVSKKPRSQPMQCDDCGSTYATKISLIKHMKVVHLPQENIQEFKCRICPQGFKLKQSLIDHLNGIHLKKFCCQVCCKVLGSAKNLETHEQKGKCSRERISISNLKPKTSPKTEVNIRRLRSSRST